MSRDTTYFSVYGVGTGDRFKYRSMFTVLGGVTVLDRMREMYDRHVAARLRSYDGDVLYRNHRLKEDAVDTVLQVCQEPSYVWRWESPGIWSPELGEVGETPSLWHLGHPRYEEGPNADATTGMEAVEDICQYPDSFQITGGVLRFEYREREEHADKLVFRARLDGVHEMEEACNEQHAFFKGILAQDVNVSEAETLASQFLGE